MIIDSQLFSIIRIVRHFNTVNSLDTVAVIILQNGPEQNGTEQFCHIILRNRTGSNAHMTAKYIAIKLPTVLTFPVSKGLYILAEV